MIRRLAALLTALVIASVAEAQLRAREPRVEPPAANDNPAPGTTGPVRAEIEATIGRTVDSAAELASLPTRGLARVVRLGFASRGDGPAVEYVASRAACTIAGGDGGSQVPSADGRCWVASLSGRADVRVWGAKCDGVSDDAARINAALEAARTARIAGVSIAGLTCLATGADIVVPARTGLFGDLRPSKKLTEGGYVTLPSALVLDGSRTVRTSDGSVVEGLAIVRQGVAVPTSIRTAIRQVAAFAGTGVTIKGTGDVLVRDVLVVGFGLCVDVSAAERTVLQNVMGDCTSGWSVDEAHDTTRGYGLHFWPFVTVHGPHAIRDYPVANAADNGGAVIRVSLSRPIAGDEIATGDTVTIRGVEGVEVANRTWTVKVITPTTIDLAGSAFSGRYRSGGQVWVNNLARRGFGIRVARSEDVKCVSCFSYGFHRGVIASTGSVWASFVDHSVDGLLDALDPDSIGYVVEGDARFTSFLGGWVSSMGTALFVGSAPGTTARVTDTMLGAPLNGLIQVGGSLYVANSEWVGGGPLRLDPGLDRLVIVGGTRGSSAFLAPPAALARVVEVGDNVSHGAADSCGPGFRCLRTPN